MSDAEAGLPVARLRPEPLLQALVGAGDRRAARRRAARLRGHRRPHVAGVRSYGELRARAVTDELPGVGRLAFAGIDDLVAMKSAADRPQDRLDIADLERVRRAGARAAASPPP